MSQHMFDSPHMSEASLPDTSDTYLLRQVHQMNQDVEAEHNVRVLDILPILDSSTEELRHACADGLETIKHTIDHINKKRWKRNVDLDAVVRKDLDLGTARLHEALRAFKDEHRMQLLAPYMPIVGDDSLMNALPLRSLYVSYVFGSAIVAVAEATLWIMELVGDTIEKRRSNRLWAPKGLRKLWKIVSAKGDQNNGVFGEDVSPHPAGATVVGQDEVDYSTPFYTPLCYSAHCRQDVIRIARLRPMPSRDLCMSYPGCTSGRRLQSS